MNGRLWGASSAVSFRRRTRKRRSSLGNEVLLRAYCAPDGHAERSFLWRPNLPDESDNHPIELAIAANAESIITGNPRDFATGELAFDTFRIVTPGNWLMEDD